MAHDFDRTGEHDDSVENYVLDTLRAVLDEAALKKIAVKTFEELTNGK